MSDSYGSGLNFAPPPNTGGSAPVDTDAPPVIEAPKPPTPGPSFGGSFRNMLPGAHYVPPDPATSALDQSANLLEQRVKRAGSVATNPIAQIFAPEQVAAARAFMPKAAEELQKIETQRSAIAAGRVQARTLGLTPGEVSDQATQDDRITVASAKALKGDMRAFQGLQAVHPERAAAIAPQVYETAARHLTRAQLAFDSLASMQNEGQYRAKVNQLRQDGTLTDLESLGMKLPASFEAFSAIKGSEGRALREARIGINTIGQKLEERNTYQPMEKKEAETYTGRLTTVHGDQVTNGQWGRNAAAGTRGLVINGAADPNDLGKKFTLATPEQREAIKKEFDGVIPKAELDKYREFNRTYKLATEDARGNKFPDGKINTNPNVQQGISEGLAAMLRGGHGGANVGLLQIETSKRGFVQGVLDTIKTNYSGALNTLSEKDVRPYLTNLTQSQIRDVMEVLKGYNDASMRDRVGHVAQRAGALGLDVSAFGLGKNEPVGAIGEAIEAGRREQIERMKPNHQAIGGGDGVLQLGAQRPGAQASELPSGTQPAIQTPGAQPLMTPVQQAGQPPQPGAPPGGGGDPWTRGTTTVRPPEGPTAPPSSGGGPSPTAPPKPVRVAGLDVNVPLPAGASPSFVPALQRIESGGTRDPWKAGTPLSSASGAFQFINSTWRENKPAGAPDRARDATPAQQTEALATLTSKNAATLKTGGLPVNDTSLYIAHNLGAGGGGALMSAHPSADARSIVGEAAARNNPMFFKGRPTVATVLQRYADAMGGAHGATPEGDDDGGPKPRPNTGGAVARRRMGDFRDVMRAGGDGPDLSGERRTPEQLKAEWRGVGTSAIEHAPAIGSTAGAVVGGLSAGPAGGIAGGALGGGGGQMLKDYLKGDAQKPIEIAKQTALGGVLGVMSVARPVAATAGRVLGAGGIEATAKAVEGGDAADVVDAGAKGAAAGLAGEAFGRALGMAGHKVYSLFAPDAQKTIQSAARTYAEASEVLRTEAPKLPGVGGAAATVNPKYTAAEAARTKSEQALKDAGLKPEEAAYAHRVSAEGVPKQEAQVAKPGALEQQRVGEGYQQLEREVGEKGVGTVKPAPKLLDGPITIATGEKMAPGMLRTAERTEMAITAPAANWQEKWTQLKDARSALLELERDALTSTTAGRTQTAKDYRSLADAVRVQQAKAAEYVFGKAEGEAVMQRLKVLDVRYRNLMEATNGGDLAKAATLKGEAGREADRKFRAFAAGDPTALQAWGAMRRAHGDAEKTVPWTVVLEGIPVVKHLKIAVLADMLRKASAERAAGSPVKFAEILNAVPDTSARATRDVLGTAGARGAVQGDVAGAMQ